ncbi:hypothetical protein [Paraclostridium sordellii]|uniref:hypothetical protein n=1 Tax=Paraclostridium sordellii TaxID=1505 RepID=UPI0005E66AC0|nr:hypothetical protein [Paeniclostridium sordellii]CEN87332.1 Uncharacterised protein [[Clostridium] sordellii] [Paeniclostridium sordellii]
MGIFTKKNKNGDRSVNLTFIDGIPGYVKGTAIALSIELDTNYLTIRPRVHKHLPEVSIDMDRLVGVTVASEKEILEKEKDKSVIGRAAIGGVLLGPLGAIVGGMSGIGTKTKSKTKSKNYIIINYKSLDNELKILSFEIVGASLHWTSFVEELNRIILPKEDEKEIIKEDKIFL